MSDTPRTDREERLPQNAGRIGVGGIFDFARQLERELNALKATHEMQREAYDALFAEKERLLAEQMTEEKAREILGDWVKEDNSLGSMFTKIQLVFRGMLATDQLRAIAWWMENMKGVQG